MNWLPLFLSIDGRIGRKDFCIGAAVLIGVSLMASLLPFIGLVVSLGLIVPWTCLLVKRLHDFGRPGLLALIAILPAAGSTALSLFTAIAASNVATMGVAFASAGLTLGVSFMALLVSLGFLIWVAAKPGDLQPNAYGAVASYAT